MGKKIDYIHTVYSPVNLPDNTGLFTKTIQSGFNCRKESGMVFLDIGIMYLLVMDGIDYQILKSVSRFMVRETAINIMDVYEAYGTAVEKLKQFPQAQAFQIERELQDISTPPLTSVEEGINLTVKKVRNDRC